MNTYHFLLYTKQPMKKTPLSNHLVNSNEYSCRDRNTCFFLGRLGLSPLLVLTLAALFSLLSLALPLSLPPPVLTARSASLCPLLVP